MFFYNVRESILNSIKWLYIFAFMVVSVFGCV